MAGLPRFSLDVRKVVIGAGILTAVACGGAGGGGGGSGYTLITIVPNAASPTQIRFSPDGRLFYTELDTGNVRVVLNGVLLPVPFATLPVSTTGEQGLLGLALDPNFASNRFVYVFHTHPSPLRQRVVRYTEAGNVGTNETVILDDLPVANNHNGGRIGFGSDGKLYVTIGDTGNPANSQDDNAVSGKLLRYNSDGSIPADNPIPGNPLYAKGLRNSFGLTFHPTSGRPYVSDNGPSCDDKLIRIVENGNYGWRPNYPCGDNDPNYLQPLDRINPSIAPTGLAFYTGFELPEFQGQLFMGSYVDGAVRRYTVDDAAGTITRHPLFLLGRPGVLDITTSPDGGLYIADATGIYRVGRS